MTSGPRPPEGASGSPIRRRDFLCGSLGAALLAVAPASLFASAPSAAQAAGGLPKLVLPHPSGARVEVFLQGAHVSSWIRPDGEDALFVSERSRMEIGQPVRGGIPIVFPQFASLGPLPAHGFVRTLPWDVVDSGVDADGAVFALLQRTDTEATRAIWPHRFRAQMRVTLDEALTTTLRVTNNDTEPFTFQTALHTYHRVGDVAQVAVEGVEGLRFLDRTAGGEPRQEGPAPLRIRGPVDRIYADAPDRIRIRDVSRCRTIVVEKEGFSDVVVWNPGADRARTMSDLRADEFAAMLCVEPANIVTPTQLEPGQTWSGTQRMRIE